MEMENQFVHDTKMQFILIILLDHVKTMGVVMVMEVGIVFWVV